MRVPFSTQTQETFITKRMRRNQLLFLQHDLMLISRFDKRTHHAPSFQRSFYAKVLWALGIRFALSVLGAVLGPYERYTKTVLLLSNSILRA